MKTRQFLSALLLAFATAGFAQVGIGTQVPNTSSMLDVDVTALSAKKGLLPPRMTQLQRDAIVSPAEGLMVYNIDSKCFEFYDGTKWQCHNGSQNNGSTAAKAALSCKAIKDSYPLLPNGTYWLDIDGTASTYAPQQAYCDMTTDGGGWTLILNYLHSGGTTPLLTVRTENFPLLGSSTLGGSEVGTQYWGHTSNAMLNKISFGELRFYGKSSSHTRLINFKTSLLGAINYVKTGTGSMNGLKTNFTGLAGHNANLPASIDSYSSNFGNNALTYFPFFTDAQSHWGLAATSIGSNRWEADDYPNNPSNSTYHQVWIR